MNHHELSDIIIVGGIAVCAQAVARHDVPRGTFEKWHTVAQSICVQVAR